MGTDSKLLHKSTGEKIYCDRLYNIKNTFTEQTGLDYYLIRQGLPQYILLDLLISLRDITEETSGDKISIKYYEDLIDKLKKYDEYDYFILIDEHDDRY